MNTRTIGRLPARADGDTPLDGANAIIALRCSKLSGRFEDFWERRTNQAVA